VLDRVLAVRRGLRVGVLLGVDPAVKARRLAARVIAAVGGYFWLPCPICREMFGGHEWRDYDGHQSYVLNDGAICPGCTRAGRGCESLTTAAPIVHLHDCEHVWRVLAARKEIPRLILNVDAPLTDEQLRHLEGRL
jgi:hypothetical protein